MPSPTVRAAKASRCDFESRLLGFYWLVRDYGVGEADGDSVPDGDGDSSAAFLVAAFFLGASLGDGDSSAVVAVFFVDVFFLAVVPA